MANGVFRCPRLVAQHKAHQGRYGQGRPGAARRERGVAACESESTKKRRLLAPSQLGRNEMLKARASPIPGLRRCCLRVASSALRQQRTGNQAIEQRLGGRGRPTAPVVGGNDLVGSCLGTTPTKCVSTRSAQTAAPGVSAGVRGYARILNSAASCDSRRVRY